MSDYNWQPKMPKWFWVLLLTGTVYAIISCFFWGKSDAEAKTAYDRAVDAKLESMKHPRMKWSDPAEFAIYNLIKE